MKYDLTRFKKAQENCYLLVREELMNGQKTGHWMWYIFPQIDGLGKSKTSKKYAIEDINEAELYLKDELLAKRLLELTRLLTYETKEKSIEEIFGFPDYLKFHSSMTLFYMVVISNRYFENNSDYFCFEDAIRKYYDGKLDQITIEILQKKTLFSNENPYQFQISTVNKNDYDFKLEYVDLKQENERIPPVGTLRILNDKNETIATIINAMGPLCWSIDKKLVALPICMMHWLKGFHQKFVIINLEKRSITYLKKIHPGEPRIIDKVDLDHFHFRHFNKNKEIIEGQISIANSEIEKTIVFPT